MRKNQRFVLSSFIMCLFLISQFSAVYAGKPKREFYQLTVYHYGTEAQEKVIEQYLEAALLPALHRAGISNIGVFKAIANDTAVDKLLYVFVPVKNLEMITTIDLKLKKDDAFSK